MSTDNREWRYDVLPVAGGAVRIPPHGVWCESLDEARFMARTGWFAAGCSGGPLPAGPWQTIDMEHFELPDVRVWVVRVRDRGGHELWVPLPDHHWS